MIDGIASRRQRALICLLLALITLAVFWPSLHHEFLDYDDQQYVTENPHVQTGLTWSNFVWAFQTNYASNWHPLTWLSHMLDCQFYGLKPAGHHATNLILHIASTVMLFLVLARLTNAVWPSAFVAALFGWHPLHVESVAWVAERKDVLSAFFWMLTLWSYAGYVEKRGWIRYVITLLFFTLGLMSKPMVVTLPFVLLLLDYWPLDRIHGNPLFTNTRPHAVSVKQFTIAGLLLEKIPFFLLTIAACALTLWAQQSGHAIVTSSQLPFSERLPHVLVSYQNYILKIFAPFQLAIFYPYIRASLAQTVLAGILLAMITFCVFKFVLRRPWLAVGWLWFLGTLVPVIGFVQAGDQSMADRYAYIPLIGLGIMAAWSLRPVERWNPPAKCAAVALCLAAAMMCRHELGYWQDTRTLFTHTATVTQSNYVAVAMLGSLQARDGNYHDAARLYTEALDYNPNFPEAHFYLGNALEKQDRPVEAMEQYAMALRLRPSFEQAHIFLGLVQARTGQADAAKQHFFAALKLNPDSAPAHNDLAKIFQSDGQLEMAIDHYSIAIRLNPNLAPAHNNLGIVLLQQGKTAEGINQLKEALRLDSGNLETKYNLALALNQSDQWEEAAALCEKLATLKPADATVFYQWGLASEHLQRTKEAMARYAHALLLNPDFPEALNSLAWILSTDPRSEFRNGAEAIKLAQQASALSRNPPPRFLLSLATAYAETGDFPEALNQARNARQLAVAAGEKNLAAKCEVLLELFRSGQPYRHTSD